MKQLSKSEYYISLIFIFILCFFVSAFIATNLRYIEINGYRLSQYMAMSIAAGLTISSFIAIRKYIRKKYYIQEPPKTQEIKTTEELLKTKDYKYIYLYSKDGVTERFTEDNLPDDEWDFVDKIPNK